MTPVESAHRALSERSREFENPRREWRRIFAEVLGTFFLVLAAAGGDMMDHAFAGGVGHAAAVTAPGLTVMAVILFMGRVSGAHLNPAVSIGFALRNDFPWGRVPGYVVAQLGGAALAAWFLQSVIHVSAVYGAAAGAAFILRGPGGGRSGSVAAQGTMDTQIEHPDKA